MQQPQRHKVAKKKIYLGSSHVGIVLKMFEFNNTSEGHNE